MQRNHIGGIAGSVENLQAGPFLHQAIRFRRADGGTDENVVEFRRRESLGHEFISPRPSIFQVSRIPPQLHRGTLTWKWGKIDAP